MFKIKIQQGQPNMLYNTDGWLRLKNEDIYFSQAYLGEDTTLEIVSKYLDEVLDIPKYDSEIIGQQKIIETIKESLENPLTVGADYTDGILVTAGDILAYNGALYKVMDGRTFITQWNWNPERTLGHLWEVYVEPIETPSAWKQPSGGHDAYKKGDKVTHKGKTWTSTYDGANVWEPGVYGWAEVTQ